MERRQGKRTVGGGGPGRLCNNIVIHPRTVTQGNVITVKQGNVISVTQGNVITAKKGNV